MEVFKHCACKESLKRTSASLRDGERPPSQGPEQEAPGYRFLRSTTMEEPQQCNDMHSKYGIVNPALHNLLLQHCVYFNASQRSVNLQLIFLKITSVTATVYNFTQSLHINSPCSLLIARVKTGSCWGLTFHENNE